MGDDGTMSPPRRRRDNQADDGTMSPPRRRRDQEGDDAPSRKRKLEDERGSSFRSRRQKDREAGEGERLAALGDAAYGKKVEGESGEGESDSKKQKTKKVKPNFGKSGKLSDEVNTTDSGTVLKWNEPGEARKPHLKWRLFPFKGDEALDAIPVYRNASYLFGRDRTIVAIPTDHPSCSGQHAVLVFREVRVGDEADVGMRMLIKPYIIDLQSANGTFLNGKKISTRRYYELRPKDVLRFGQSSRDYVLLHDEIAGTSSS